MIPESKIIDFIIAIGVLIFVLLNYSRIKELDNSKILLSAFSFLFANIVLSILEELFWQDFLNIIQHSCITLSSIFLIIWCVIIFTKKRKNSGHSNHY